MPSSALIRHAGREGLFIDARLVAAGAPAFEVLLRYLADVDDVTRADFDHLRTMVEAGWQRWGGSSLSPPPVPHPDSGGHDRIGTTDAAAILGRTPRAVRKMCMERRLPGARQDGPKGEWSVPRAVVEQFSGIGTGRSGPAPDPGGGVGSDGFLHVPVRPRPGGGS